MEKKCSALLTDSVPNFLHIWEAKLGISLSAKLHAIALKYIAPQDT